MMFRCSIAVLFLLLVATVAESQDSNTRSVGDNSDPAIGRALAEFHQALNELFRGKIEPMKNVWSHGDDITYLGPAGGILVGWDRVLESWEQQAAKQLGGKVSCEQIHITAGQNLAVAVCNIVGENYVQGKPQKVSIRATSTFRNEGGQWKMIGHHTDLLPFL